MVAWLEKVGLLCPHFWRYETTVEDWNFRAGIKHRSMVYHCTKCGRYKTIELP